MEEDKKYEDVCSVCRRSESVTGPQLRMPGNTMICKDCLQRTFDSLGNFGGMFPFGDIKFSTSFNINPNENKPEQDRSSEVTENAEDAIAAEVTAETEPAEQTEEETTATDEKKDKSATNTQNPSLGGLLDSILGGFLGGKNGPSNVFFNIGGPEMPGNHKVVKKKKAESEPMPELKIEELPPPHVIKSCLDDYVIGQEQAKKIISVAVYNHYKRVTAPCDDDVEIEKSNLLMLGPTGCGKTYLVKTLARILNVPLAITDATTLTEAGYIGDDVESVLSKLLMAADNDVERAEKGIVFIDEIDKIAKKRNTNSRDVSGESVQQGLLKLLEGADVEVPVGATSKNAMVPLTTINTSNILFVCGGAFPDLEEIVKARLNKHSSMGFDADLRDKYDNDPDLLSKVSTEDLREYGMIPEFLGRLPVICALQGLTKESYKRILTEPKNAIIKQYKKLLALDEVELIFDESALDAIAEKAIEKKTGARALRAIIEDFMLDIMYEIPKDDNIGRVTITGDYINKKGAPVVDMRGA